MHLPGTFALGAFCSRTDLCAAAISLGCYRLQEVRNSGFDFSRADKRDVGYNSKRLATNPCRCWMILTSAEGWFAEIATDPEKLLRMQRGLLQQPQLDNFCAAASTGVSSVPWLLQMQSLLFWPLGHCKSNFDRRKNSFINILYPRVWNILPLVVLVLF